MDKFSEKLAVITGGSRGMGAAMVKKFSAEGWRVIFTFNSNIAAANAVLSSCSGDIQTVKCNIGEESDILALFDQIDASAARFSVLINNAGITGTKTRLADVSVEQLNAVAQTNFIGTTLMCREAVKRMSTAAGGKGGAILNISSTAVKLGSPDQWIHYAATKGAIDVLTNGLAREVGNEGIRVNALSPGYTMTDPAHEEAILDRFDAMRHEVPLDRIGTVEEIADAAYWLCSNNASYITGAVLPVAGGR